MAKDNNFIIIGFDLKSYAFLNKVNRQKIVVRGQLPKLNYAKSRKIRRNLINYFSHKKRATQVVQRFHS